MIDKGGVTSDEAAATIEANSSTHTVTFKVVDEEGGTLTGSYGSTSQIASGSSTATLTVPRGENVTFAAAPALGWEVDSWSSNVNVDSSDNKKATLSNVSDDVTVTVKFKKKKTVNSSDYNAWKLLKKVVEIADNNAVITIDGEIKATSGENAGEIVIKGKSLKIKGKTGAENDILDASKMSRIFKVENGTNLILENLTLTGGKANGDEDAGSGGAIFARDANDIKIENCIITDNKAKENGGGIYVESTYTTITNCIFTKNTARDGGGIYINRTGPSTYVVEISGGTIGGIGQANKASGNGGGIYVGASCELRLKDYSTGSDVYGVLIRNNSAANGGGVYAAKNATVSMQGGTRIDEYNYNYVYLDSGSGILVNKPLTAASPVALITVPEDDYNTSTKVLYGDAVSSEHGKFAVKPKGTQQWGVNSYGHLQPK